MATVNDDEEKIDELDVSGNVIVTNHSMRGDNNNNNNNNNINNNNVEDEDDSDYDSASSNEETKSIDQENKNSGSSINRAFGGNDDLSSVPADVDIVIERAEDVLHICDQVANVNVKSIPHFRETLVAFIQAIKSEYSAIKEFTGLNDIIDNSLRNLRDTLVEAHKLLSDVLEISSTLSLTSILGYRKYKNKIRQCQTNLQGIENRLFNAVHAERWNMNQSEFANMNNQFSTMQNTTQKNTGRKRTVSNLTGARKTQAEEWCMTADRYYSGLGVSQSYETALRNYKKAAKSGLVRAINCLGCMYQYGRGTQEDLKEAEYWFRQAADLGDADGMNNLAMLLEDKLGNSLDEYLNGNTEGTHTRHGGISQSNSYLLQTMRDIEVYFLNAAEQGHLDAMNNLGRLYEYADSKGRASISRSYPKAFEWYEKAAKGGYSKGQVNLGSMYYSGRGLKSGPSYERAAKLFRQAADQGDPIAQNNLGICYEMGRGVPKDYLAASELYAKSAKLGNPSGMNNWGYMLVRQAESVGGGEDAPQYIQAVDLFRAAIAAGDALDSEKFQMFSSRTLHGNKKYAGAARKRDRTEMGHCSADACFNLATLYEAGYGVTRDLPAAFMYYVKAADYPGRPHTRAASRAGAMLYSGSGCRRNFQMAKKYYLKAASKGDADAENALGIMIEDGLGNDPEMKGIGDPKKAAVWYRRAGQQGNLYALLNLARLHVRGLGVDKSISFAKHLLDRAADNGLHEARLERARLNSLRDENIEDVHSYLGLVDFAAHEFDLNLIRESGRRAQEAALRTTATFDIPSTSDRNSLHTNTSEAKQEIERQVRFDNRLQETRLRDPPPGIRPANVMNFEDARIQEKIDPRMNVSPSGKSLIASSFNSNYRNDKTNNNNNNNNVNRKVHSQEPRLPKPPPGIRSASIIEADMSSDDLKRLQDLQQDLEYNQSTLLSRYDDSGDNFNGNNDNAQQLERIHHEVESLNNSSYNNFDNNSSSKYDSSSSSKRDEHKLPPPPPGIHTAASLKNVNNNNDAITHNLTGQVVGTPPRPNSELGSSMSGSANIGTESMRQNIASPTLPPRKATQQISTSPSLPPRQMKEEPSLPPRNLNQKPITPRRKKKLFHPREDTKISMLKEKLDEVIDAYGEDTLDAALVFYRLGERYRKISEQNCKLVPDDPTYSIGIADAEDYYRQSLHIRLELLGGNDPLVTKTYTKLALLFGRLGEHHNLYHKSAEYSQKAIDSKGGLQ